MTNPPEPRDRSQGPWSPSRCLLPLLLSAMLPCACSGPAGGGTSDVPAEASDPGDVPGDVRCDGGTCPTPLPGPALVLTFDDAYVDQWYAHRELFRRYGAKVSFMVTHFEQLTEVNLEQLRALQADGHEIGCHTLTHVTPREYAEVHGVEGFIDDEILPALAAMRAAGLRVQSFSYPRGGRSEALDEALAPLFRMIRGSGTVDDPRCIYHWDGSRYVGSGWIDEGQASIEEIDAAMDSVRESGAALVLRTHGIVEESTKLHITPATLEAVLAAAKVRGLAFCTLSELNRDDPPLPSQEIGSEVIYEFLDEGSIEAADDMLRDSWYTETRYPSVTLPWPLTWTEDPLGEKYWRFLFYSLRPTAHLLHAYRVTGDVRYRDKLVAVLRSFVERGEASGFTEDKHTQAFLAMVLVNSYRKLQRWGDLPDDLARSLEGVIQRRGQYLAEPSHFEPNNNHGVTEAAALLLIAHEFPAFPQSASWHALAADRLAEVVRQNVAADGVQIEQSPFYHFYVLNFFWQIFHWDQRSGAWGDASFADTIARMFRFATYVTTPDGWVPLIGSSKFYEVRAKSLQREMATWDPLFRYVWTLGADGDRPAESSVLFPESGWAILRSGFGPAATYDQATQLIFDVGPYRTGHSHLDALAVHLYARGRTLLTDSGLFTYEAGEQHDRFFGTAAHNTVVVDGVDQAEGAAHPGLFVAREGFAYQSGYHDLYPGLRHRRGVALIGADLAIVLDRVEPRDAGDGSPPQHRFEQAWHLFPEAEMVEDGTSITARAAGESLPAVAVRQLLPEGCDLDAVRGQAEPYRGWFSSEYEVDVPAWEITCAQAGVRAEWATLIATGPLAADVPKATVRRDPGRWTVTVARADGSTDVLVVAGLGDPGETAIWTTP